MYSQKNTNRNTQTHIEWEMQTNHKQPNGQFQIPILNSIEKLIQIPHISITKLRNINFNTCCCHIKCFGIKSCKLIKWKIKTREITYSKLKLDSIIKCNILPTGRKRERKSINQMGSIICERRYQKSQNTAAQHIMRLSFTFIYIHTTDWDCFHSGQMNEF